MYAEIKMTRVPDLRTSGAVSLAVHAALILMLGVAVTHSRAHFTPPAIRAIRLDVDLPPPVAAATTVTTPSASPVEVAAPQAAAVPPRPDMTVQNEQRLAPPSAPQDVAPAAPDSVAAAAAFAGGVTTFVTTETTSKSIFGTGVEDVLDVIPAGSAGPAGRGNGVGVEGPISFRRDMRPLYPLGARQRGEEGTVVLETLVTPDGRAFSVAVVSSSNFPELDRAAVKAVERAAFNPATEDGRAVEARARITIIFRLTN